MILSLNYWVHIVLIVGCVLSTFSGPVVVLRWAALPYQAIVGFVPHMIGVWLVSYAASSKAAEICINEALEGNVMAEHAAFFKLKSESQWYMALIYTLLISFGCLQSRTRDNVVLKKQFENR